MKFTIFTEAFVALSLLSPTLATPVDSDSQALSENNPRACELKVQWLSNWNEAGLRRYRVQLITSPRNDEHLTRYANAYPRNPQSNVQAFWENGMFLIDSSYAEGPAGHSWYKTDHNSAAGTYQSATGCFAVLNL